MLAGEDVDLGAREVRQPARVVDVEVGEDDVADVSRVEACGLDLGEGDLAGLKLRAGEGEERTGELSWVLQVPGPEAGIDEHEAIGGLDEQHVADDPSRLKPAAVAIDQAPAPRTHRPAVQMVDGEGGHGAARGAARSA